MAGFALLVRSRTATRGLEFLRCPKSFILNYAKLRHGASDPFIRRIDLRYTSPCARVLHHSHSIPQEFTCVNWILEHSVDALAIAIDRRCIPVSSSGRGYSKHALAPYRSGRSRTWLKTKCFTESTFVVVGTDRDRKTGALRALLAHNDGSGLNYAGAAFIALSGDERAQFLAELERLATSWASFKSSRLHDVKWCHPKLVVEVKHLAGSKSLRHATVRGLAK